jgi:hypothetical protein
MLNISPERIRVANVDRIRWGRLNFFAGYVDALALSRLGFVRGPDGSWTVIPNSIAVIEKK